MKTFNLFVFGLFLFSPFVFVFSQEGSELDAKLLDTHDELHAVNIFKDLSDHRVISNGFIMNAKAVSTNYPELGFTYQRTSSGDINKYVYDRIFGYIGFNPNDMAYANDPYLHPKSSKVDQADIYSILKARANELIQKAEVDAYNKGYAWRNKNAVYNPSTGGMNQYKGNQGVNLNTNLNSNRGVSNYNSRNYKPSNTNTIGGSSPKYQNQGVSHTSPKKF
ncbi:MAG: hypothetical protein R2799_04610 [Crocinitomicaceae bacterium]